MTIISHQLRLLAALLVATVLSAAAAADRGSLSDNQRIDSTPLGYSLMYRVYTPAGIEDMVNVPTLYITDGQWYISRGRMVSVLNREIEKGTIKPVVVVFVDNRNPDNLMINRRNSQFFCNPLYVMFFAQELVPRISEDYPVSMSREDRVVLGVSFGGLNSACFGLTAHPTFGGIAMQSPALHPVPQLEKLYETEDTRPIKIFFSLGSRNDNTSDGRRFRRILERKGYDMLYKEVPHGHNWDNWQPLLDDLLIYFFAPDGG